MNATKFQSLDPYTNQLLAEYPTLTQTQADQKLERATKAWKSWRKSSFTQRSDLLLNVAQLLEKHNETYARIITAEMGKHIREARAEVAKCITACTYYAEHAEKLLADQTQATPFHSKVVFDPIGCVFTIMPWNFPFWQVFRQATASLAAGNVLLLKHAQNVTGCSLAIESIFRDAGCPDGVFQSLIMDSSDTEYIIQHPIVQAVTITGSEKAGSSVAALAGKHIKKTVLELGGSDPVLVLDDANLDHAAQVAVQSRMQNAGQSCIAAKRFLVTKATADVFTEKVYQQIKQIKQGDPMDEATTMGPMARVSLAEDLDRQLQNSLKNGAVLLLGGHYNRASFQPTLLGETHTDMPVFTEETFGPLASIFVVSDEKTMITAANQNRYGLGASIWSEDRQRAEYLARDIEAGMVCINSMVRSDVRLPFGGIKKSGYGRELAGFGLRELVNTKTIIVE